jgi:glucose/arabinose dehydrogenase
MTQRYLRGSVALAASLVILVPLLAGRQGAAAHQGHCEKPRPSKTVSRDLRLRYVGTFDSPVYVSAAPGDRRRLFVVERAGRIRVLRDGRKVEKPFLDISSEVLSSPHTERGMFSLAFAPDYPTSRRFYVFYSDLNDDIRVHEFRRSRTNPDSADLKTRREVLFAEHFGKIVHFGGQLQFGPDDLLYLSLGEADRGEFAQDLSSPLGKLLRIDPRPAASRAYRIPPHNPFVGRDGARPEIYAYGLRNPYRFSFDRQTGDLVIGDAGDHAAEEVDLLRRGRARAPRGGANFGWPHFEGRLRRPPASAGTPRYVPPVLQRLHPEAHAITGGYVARDRSLRRYYGRYIYGDFCDGSIRSAVLDVPSAKDDRPAHLIVPFLSSFGEDLRGRLYATSLRGRVYRLERR